jgi:tripartite-type tricarboxylate transporter receptor subunit TctC
MQTVLRSAAALLALAGFGLPSAPAQAQQWPAKPVTVIVPFAAGGNVDAAARIFSERLSQRLGQQFVIENKSGAGGSIGIGAMTKASPDGYTLAVVSAGTLFILPHIYREKLGYDGLKDIRPIAMVAYQPNMLIVDPNKVPATTPAELFAYLKANPGKLSYGSSGIGTSQHLCMELIVQHTGAKIAHVPYRASNQIIQDLLGGQIQMTCDQFSTAYPLVQGGKARAIGVSSLQRYPMDPSIPALAETVPGLEVTWSAVFVAPAKVPAEIANKLAAELRDIAQDPAMVERLKKLGVTPVAVTGDELRKQILSDYEKWKPIVERAKIPQP